ncbi:MAG: CHAT domain-containing protein [Cyanobacteria bacterium P01_A01_bin.116]
MSTLSILALAVVSGFDASLSHISNTPPISWLVAELGGDPQGDMPASLFAADEAEDDTAVNGTAVDSTENDVGRLLEAADEAMHLEDSEAAIALYQRALTLIEQAPSLDANEKGEALSGLGTAYFYSDQYDLALETLEQALSLYQTLATEEQPNFTLSQLAESPYASILIDLLGQLGSIHHERANFATALTYYQWGLQSEDPEIRAFALHDIGAVETSIGQYEQAVVTLQQSVSLSQSVGDSLTEASAVFTLGWAQELQENYGEAIANYKKAIALFDSLEEPDRQARIFNNLGTVHLKQGNLAAAREAFEQGFALIADDEDSTEQSILLASLGALYQTLGELDPAWRSQLKALQLSKQTEYTLDDTEVLLNLGGLMEEAAEPALAIFFYKQAIARIETVRQDLQQLPVSEQQDYTQTVEYLYRHLADLLLQQDRVPEALQILDLLKLQEVSAYLHDDLSDELGNNLNSDRPTDAESPEEPTDQFNTLPEADLRVALAELPEDIALEDFLARPAVVALLADDTPSVATLPAVETFQSVILEQGLQTAVLYPLILEERLEIILITPEGAIDHVAMPITRTDMVNKVGELQKKLKNSALDPTEPAGDLYDWLIRPIEEQLSAQGVENIIYLPDSVLRYVPLATLHDGEHFLVEKMQSHNITAAQVHDLLRKDTSPLSVLAGAFIDSSTNHTVQVGPQSFNFQGLSAAEQEIENLQKMVPDTEVLLNDAFGIEETLAAVGGRRILHLATHAKFVPGQPEESFILFGDGGTVNIQDIRDWKLPGVDLVVLSACQTASSFEGEGKEILGLGFQLRQTGAASAIASLWTVDDTSTAALMTQFYEALSAGETKAQALRTAQVAMINSKRYSHPYDWSAFILIGNGL